MAAPRAAKAAAPRRSAWWVVHHWAGLKLGVLLSFVLLTGTIATVANEIDWLVNPAMRAAPQAGPVASWGALYRAAAGIPGFTIEEVAAPMAPGFAVRVKGKDAQGRSRFVHINPLNARVQGIGSSMTVQDLVRDLHRALMLPTKVGIIIVTLLSFPLLLTLATAPKIYKRWWKGFLRLPRPMRDKAKDARRYAGDLHRLAGLWSFWFIALIGVTGLWYLGERLGVTPDDVEPPSVPVVKSSVGPPDVDAIVATAARHWPAFKPQEIAFDDGVVTLAGQAGAILVRHRANQMWFEASTGHPLGRHDATMMTANQRIAEAVDPLHFGNWGGLPTKILWFVFGLLLSGLSITGTVICALRLGSPGKRIVPLFTQMGFGALAGGLLIILAMARLTIAFGN